MIKQIMIPVAAFAVTATAASAFNPDMLEKLNVDLTDSQLSALEEAHELRSEGANQDEIQTLLEEAGLDQDAMKEIRGAAQEMKRNQREVVHSTLASGDYDAFMEAIEDSPLAGAIDAEDDFKIFQEAHDLRESGDKEGAAELMSELGIEKPQGHGHKGGDFEKGHKGGFGKQGAERKAE